MSTTAKPTTKQIEYATALGISTPEKMSRGALKLAIDSAREAQKERARAARGYPITQLIAVESMTRISPIEYSGPCPKCGGSKRFKVNTEKNGWWCRHCTGEKWQDPIAWLRFRGSSFLDALNTLDGGTVAPVVIEASSAPTPAKKRSWMDEDWQQKTQAEAQNASAQASAEGSAAAEYLAGRGITPEAARRWRVGGAVHKGTPCITFPYWGARNGQSAIKVLHYAAIDRASAGWRYSLKSGSERGLYGAWLCRPGDNRTLILCEGELNAISISIAAGDGCDVVSFGSEAPSARTLDAIRNLAARYALVIVWADEAENALQVGKVAAEGCAAVHGTCSPRNEAGKQDANDLLQSGELPAYIEALRDHAFTVASERLARLYAVTRSPEERARYYDADERLLQLEATRLGGGVGVVL